MWRKKGKILKGGHFQNKKESTGGRVALFMVTITHGKKVIKCCHYNGNIYTKTFANLLKELFPEMFKDQNNIKVRIVLQDRDPSQKNT